MQINNLGGARMPVTTAANSASQTAQTSFSTRLQASSSAPIGSRPGITGSSIVSTAISVNSGSIPGSGFGAPYLQATPSTPTAPTASGTTATQGQTSATTTTGTASSGLTPEQQSMMDLMKMSLQSFMSGTFSMGQNRPGIEALDD